MAHPRADQQAVPVGSGVHVAVYVSAGTSCSEVVSEPCMPSNADSLGSALVATMAMDPAGAATTSPIRLAMAGSTGPNQPSLMASSLDSTQARSPRTSRQMARRSAAAPRRAYRCLARGSPPSRASPDRSSGVASTSNLSSGPMSTMPWSAVTYRNVPEGSALASCSASLSTWASWLYQASEPTPNTCPVLSRSPWYTVTNARPFSQMAVAACAARAPMLSAGQKSAPRMVATVRPVPRNEPWATCTAAMPAAAARS